MMSFNIRFLGELVEGSELGNSGLRGEIELGSHREEFIALIGFWSPLDYEHQWRAGVRRLVESRESSCLITSLHDPAEADVITWWLLYPMESRVFIQNALLLPRELTTPFSTRNPYLAIPPRRTITEEGHIISEWELPLFEFDTYFRAA
jgi:CdiI N-terminal domain